MARSLFTAFAAASLLLGAAAASAQPKADPPKEPAKKPNVIKLEGIEALRYLAKQGQPVDAEKVGYVLLWVDIRKPEEIALLAQSLAKMGRRSDAATWYRLFLRVAADKPDEAAPFKVAADSFLKFGDRDHDNLVKQYRAKAGGKFPAPEAVSDLWMTQVTGDLSSLSELQAWKLVGGNKEAKDPNWIHNHQGVMHRSGLKLMDEVDGRKGVLMALPRPRATRQEKETDKPKAAADDKPKEAPAAGRGAAVRLPYAGKGKVLRIGAKGWTGDFILEISVAQQKLLSQRVTATQWHDLKVDLPAAIKVGDEIVVELLPPQGQRHHQGAWLDYLDVFED